MQMALTSWFMKVALALEYLHGLDITHGDLKPENLVLSSNEEDASHVKVLAVDCIPQLVNYPFTPIGHRLWVRGNCGPNAKRITTECAKWY
jgi:serine/threonine protein kinase